MVAAARRFLYGTAPRQHRKGWWGPRSHAFRVRLSERERFRRWALEYWPEALKKDLLDRSNPG
jgi:hypothetical protein